MDFQLTPTPLEKIDLRQGMTSDAAGAFITFEGRVRGHNDGKTVVALEYEAYETLCHSEAIAILDESKQKFGIMAARLIHRVGKLRVGDMAVWIGVLAAHREEAFAACRYIIDETKKRLPIWKKEYYSDGHSGWVACTHDGAHNHTPVS